jgi:hypothetical protein
MISILQVRRVFKLYPKWANVTANESLVLSACGNREDVHIGNTIEQMGASGQLALSSDYSNVFRTFFEKFPRFRTDASESMLAQRLVHFDLSVTLENLERQLDDVEFRNSLAPNPSWVAEQHESRETERMVSEITGYMLGPDSKVKREYTQRQYNEKVASLRAMPFSELVARYDSVMAARAQRKAPVEELRAVVKTDAARQRQALYERYEKIPPTYVPPGKSEGVNWSFALFKRLPSMEQRRLLDHFGNDQITAACAARGN